VLSNARRCCARGLVLVLLCLLAVPLAARASQAAVATVRDTGYLTMSDGVRLRYTVERPATGGPYPTLFEYSGYDPGNNPDSSYITRFVKNDGGYAYIGVNVRGTGCSEGTFDFFQPQEAKDGAAVIDWVTHQSWSDGKVGMIGKSYPGITQLFVAEEQPPGLVAIAPGHFFGDAYRDIARPGGIINYGFSSLWSFIGRPSYEFQSGPGEVAGGDPDCVNASTAEIRGAPTNPFVQLLQHPYDDALVRERSPNRRLDRIQVPMLATLSWQDEQLGSRNTDLLAQLDDLNLARRQRGEAETPWWAMLSNGDHGMARTANELTDLERFYDHFLKGENNNWDTRPRVRVWWESKVASRAASWTTALDHWSESQRAAAGRLEPWALNLRSGGGLTEQPAAAGEASESYLYTPPAGSQGIANPAYGYPSLPDRYFWTSSPPDGTALAWTTAPFSTDRTLLGSASLDVWLASTAVDTDLQVTLTEVRPDGQEQYIQKGWLRASQRALDATRSTALRPWQTHQQADVAMLTPGQPALMRVEIFPFGHVIRQGSRLRVWVEAPTTLPELWSFVPFPTPAQNTVLHDAAHPTRLVLPLVPNDANRVAAAPACGTVIRQPCRPDPLTTAAEPVVPEVPLPVVLPLAALALLAAGVVVRRRVLP
jgi:putative CocE/NonD family hydrolase